MDSTLTDAELLDLAGESSLSEIKDLNLRSRGLTSIEDLSPRLPALLALSLSHNKLRSMQGVAQLRCLLSINVNFNALASLDGIQSCHSLQQLYAGNNAIRDLRPLAGLMELRTVNMYRNTVSSLEEAASVLSSLPCLTELDLSGNPCSLVPSYKRRMILGLQSLASLDGEQLTELDIEMAQEEMDQIIGAPGGEGSGAPDIFINENSDTCDTDAAGTGGIFLSNNERIEQLGGALERDPGELLRNPSTASTEMVPLRRPPTVNSLQRPGTSSLQRPGTAAQRPGTASQRPSTAAQRPGTANGGASVRLVTNEFLNEHPLLLEYLAKHVLMEGLTLVQQGGASAENIAARLRSGSFVSRLRSTAAASAASEGLDPRAVAASGQQAIASMSGLDTRAAALESLVANASPDETIRQLVKLCEVLIKEVEAVRQLSQGSSGLPQRPGSGQGASLNAGSQGSSGLPQRPGSGKGGSLTAGSQGVVPAASAHRPGSLGISSSISAAVPSQSEEEISQLRSEVLKLTREVKQLKVENQNMFWLADEYKRLKAESKNQT